MNLSRLPIGVLGLTLATIVSAGGLPTPQQVAPHSYAWIGPYGPPA